MKRTSKIVSMFIASLFIISVISQSNIMSVQGRSGSAVFCPNNVQDVDTENELLLSLATCEAISEFFADRYDDVHIREDYWASYNQYIDVIDSLDTSYQEVGFFSKGHRSRWGSGGAHIALISHDDTIVKDSTDIYPITSGKFEFVFLWHCETSCLYDPLCEDDDGWIGFPYCFTHNPDMVLYGQDTGYNVFVGWYQGSQYSGGSPQFEYVISEQFPNYDWQYAHWAYLFFEAMSWGWTVEGAKNYACNTIFSADFTSTPLYYWLIVWGCEDICWPY